MKRILWNNSSSQLPNRGWLFLFYGYDKKAIQPENGIPLARQKLLGLLGSCVHFFEQLMRSIRI